MSWTVSKIIDGDTFEVKEDWKWGGTSGNRVRPIGFDAPERGQFGFDAATKKLSDLLCNKQVDLRDCVKVDRGRLVCKVFIQKTILGDAINIADLLKKTSV